MDYTSINDLQDLAFGLTIAAFCLGIGLFGAMLAEKGSGSDQEPGTGPKHRKPGLPRMRPSGTFPRHRSLGVDTDLAVDRAVEAITPPAGVHRVISNSQGWETLGLGTTSTIVQQLDRAHGARHLAVY